MIFLAIVTAVLCFSISMLIRRSSNQSSRLNAQTERLDRQFYRVNAQVQRLDEHAEWLRNLGKLRERQDERITELEAQVRDLIGDGR